MSLIGVEKTCAIKSDMCEHVFTHYWVGGDEGMTLLNSCQGAKELGLILKFENLDNTSVIE